jgi:hypothetical protein
MRIRLRAAIFATLAAVLLGTVCASKASAQCGFFNSIQPQLWVGPPQTSLLLAGSHHRDDPIVGFWKASFVSKGSSNIPDGTVVDSPFVQWHSDGTEIMNSSRVPSTGNFCLGVWRSTGQASYELNHFAKAFDPSGNFIGPTQIRESVTLNDSADQYTGTFTIDQYDQSHNLLQEIVGQISATRITVDTTVDQVL